MCDNSKLKLSGSIVTGLSLQKSTNTIVKCVISAFFFQTSFYHGQNPFC